MSEKDKLQEQRVAMNRNENYRFEFKAGGSKPREMNNVILNDVEMIESLKTRK